jgi:hypothetical protein
MITPEKLEELRKREWKGTGTFECGSYAEDIMPEVLDTIEALWKVARGVHFDGTSWATDGCDFCLARVEFDESLKAAVDVK